MSRLLEGKVALVTGAGRGIGREHALMLAEHGAKLVVNDLGGGDEFGGGADMTPAAEVVEAITSGGGEAVVNGGSVASFDDAGAMVQQASSTLSATSTSLVNNAGILRDRMVFSMTEDDWDTVVAVHLKGTFGPSHHAAGLLAQQGQVGARRPTGGIINTTSPSGIYGNVGQTNYGAAKAGIAAFTVIAAQELVRYGVDGQLPGSHGMVAPHRPADGRRRGVRRVQGQHRPPLGRGDHDVAGQPRGGECDRPDLRHSG